MDIISAWEPTSARRVERMRASEIRELLKLIEQPGIISFAGGIPDPKLFPAEAAAEAYAAALSGAARAAMQYSVSEGYGPLRDFLARAMTEDGVPATSDTIAMTAGSQQALHFLAKLLITPASPALVPSP